MGLDFFEDGDDADFEALLAGEGGDIKSGFNPGEKVTGTVVDITSNSILVDVNATSEGVIDRSQFEENGELTVAVGDTVDAFFAGMVNGEIILTGKMKSQDVDRSELENAYNASIPVEGKVTGTNNAGLEVMIGGVRGFCPASQVDIAHIEDLSVYTGQTLTFIVLEMSEHNLVLSRRRYLESQREEKQAGLKESLSEGDMVTGTVTKIMDFGAFVDLGGIDGLVPVSEVAWERVNDVSEYVTAGEAVTVKILKLDWDKKRLTLSIKQAGSNPWDGIEDEYRGGIGYKGTVTRLASFGAFVQLKPGVEGLIHISKLGQGRRLSHPREVVEEGQQIEVFVEAIDLEKRRISLALDNAQPDSGEGGEQLFAVGQEVKGTVVEHRPFGAFVQLAPKTRGLLHVSELESEGGGSRQALLQKVCPLEKEITVRIKEVRDGKLSLALPGTEDRDQEFRNMMTEQKKESEDFGSLGNLFDNL